MLRLCVGVVHLLFSHRHHETCHLARACIPYGEPVRAETAIDAGLALHNESEQDRVLLHFG